MIYLANATIGRTDYDSETEYFDVSRIVIATNKKDAESKFCKYYDDKSENYGVYYRVRNLEIHQAIQ